LRPLAAKLPVKGSSKATLIGAPGSELLSPPPGPAPHPVTLATASAAIAAPTRRCLDALNVETT
jgi:hypothetical protein